MELHGGLHGGLHGVPDNVGGPQQTMNTPPIAAAASTPAVQQVQSPIKLDVPVFEGDSAASWFTWSQRVVYQTRACCFGAELAAAEGERVSVGADVFDRSDGGDYEMHTYHG